MIRAVGKSRAMEYILTGNFISAQEAEKYFVQIYTADENKALGWAKEKGVQVFTDLDKPAFVKRIQPVYETFVKKYPFGKELLGQVQAVNKK